MRILAPSLVYNIKWVTGEYCVFIYYQVTIKRNIANKLWEICASDYLCLTTPNYKSYSVVLVAHFRPCFSLLLLFSSIDKFVGSGSDLRRISIRCSSGPRMLHS